MIHPATELRHVDDKIGLGVFAVETLPRGTVTWVQDPLDQVLDTEFIRRLPSACAALVERYSFFDRHGNRVLSWDHCRYMNHSCEPTCAGSEMGFDVALTDISPGEQLTNDYAMFGLMEGRDFTCHCGSTRCRRRITSRNIEDLQQNLDSQVAAALALSASVPQPLAFLFRPDWLAGRFQIAMAKPATVAPGNHLC